MILVTGGMGYIGSHTVVELANAGEKEIVIVDNLYNAKIEVLDKIKKLADAKIHFYQVDVCDKAALEEVFKAHEITCVIHFAGLKAVGESVAKPLFYYKNNIDSTLVLLEVMKEYGIPEFDEDCVKYLTPVLNDLMTKTLEDFAKFECDSNSPIEDAEYIIRDENRLDIKVTRRRAE